MTTDKNKVSELLVSNLIWQMRDAHGRAPVVLDKQLAQAQGAAEDMEAELSRLRQERDELLGALRPLVGMWIAFTEDDEDGPADISHENAYQTFYKGMSGEWNKARAILSKHKPE